MAYFSWQRRLLWVIVVAFVMLAGACAPLNPKPEAPSVLVLKQVKPSIRGTITSVFQTSGIPHGIFVDGIKESDTSYDKAFIRLVDTTRIYVPQNQGYALTSAAYLTIGLQAEVLFTGTILESYPVQATAEEILILEATPSTPLRG